MHRSALVFLLLLAAAPTSAQIRAGDVVFQATRSTQGQVIREVTNSPWSHVGLVLSRDARLYCSELIFMVFERALGVRLVEPQRWRDLRLGPRGEALARRRLGRLPPPDAPLVTPVALATTSRLQTVENAEGSAP